MGLLHLHDIEKAYQRIKPFIHKTSLVSSSLLNHWLGHEILFKTECLQRIGAFKARGGCNTVSWLVESGQAPAHIVANSSGNHAQAVAWAARQFNIPSTIYMPATASSIKIQATKSYGAEVVLCDTRAESDALTAQAAEENGTYWIPPFNHDQVIAGQGTVALEVFSEVEGVDAIFAPCGGGGLLSGTVVASHALSSSTQVFGAEPLNANDAAQSIRANKIVQLSEPPQSLADGAMTLSVGDITFEYLKQSDDIYEIEELAIVYWTQWLTHLLKLQVEPTSSLAMEAAAKWLSHQKSKKKVVVILSGGNIDQPTRLNIWKENHLQHVPHLYN